ncbi:uncharacterized protein HMPREF1541_08387 [Cyphellophora europaea CBS 101466]|uniref:endo-1,3(4)-beta-glucanase n=1 Tax=Cyphellophora europaea (strain CBS 101466) TaxID=1220924 RepID=W2RLM8_CYPE1|nr:uncharacterized protein HMPREF1541_08387 [Cyphellophora europaea CBS 101466]ETN37396.1 hypothetical protein HMPREF1541_08387 [Cyphellophora europaea CBS 101466]
MLPLTSVLCLGLVSLSRAGYILQDDYSPTNFFSQFDFFTADDPTHGYVNYVDQATATANGLINTNNGTVYMAADSTNFASGRGRNSVRITSRKAYNTGLIILDLEHMPGGACGEWPAFWTVGPNWPNSGEIDIIEGVNSQSSNAMALHTSSGCSISAGGGNGSGWGNVGAQNAMSGTIVTPNCDVAAQGQAANAGCSIKSSDTSTYGSGFNAAGGGIYATEWTSSTIKIWAFTRGNIPADIASGNPIPANWGTPLAVFGAPCQIGNYIKDQNIVFDITFCGDWAGNVWNTDSTCSALGNSCQAYVQSNPAAFKNSYWSINSLRVYSQQGGAGPSASGYPGWQPQPTNVPQGHGQGQGGAPPVGPGQGQAGGQQGQGGWGQQSWPQGSGRPGSDQQWGPPQSPNPGNANVKFSQYQGQSRPQSRPNGNNYAAAPNQNQKWGGQGNYYFPRPVTPRSTVEAPEEEVFERAVSRDAPSSPLNNVVEEAAPAELAEREAARGYAPYVGANGNIYQGQSRGQRPQNQAQGQGRRPQNQGQVQGQRPQKQPPKQTAPAVKPNAAVNVNNANNGNARPTVTVTTTITSGVVTSTLKRGISTTSKPAAAAAAKATTPPNANANVKAAQQIQAQPHRQAPQQQTQNQDQNKPAAAAQPQQKQQQAQQPQQPQPTPTVTVTKTLLEKQAAQPSAPPATAPGTGAGSGGRRPRRAATVDEESQSQQSQKQQEEEEEAEVMVEKRLPAQARAAVVVVVEEEEEGGGGEAKHKHMGRHQQKRRLR